MPRIPIDQWVNQAVSAISTGGAGLFGPISIGVNGLIAALVKVLMLPPAPALAAIFALLAWWVRSLPFGIFTFLVFLLIDAMGLWAPAMSTLALVLVASIIALAIGIPIGIVAALNDRVSTIIRPILDFMQTMPAFVYLIPAVTFFGIGTVPGVIATLIFAMPAGVRLTELGIRQVDKEVVEAGEAFGSPPSQILFKIRVPLALPTIMAGVNQVIMLSLSMVVIAGIVGAGGLGSSVYQSITRLDVGVGFEGGLGVVILAIFLDRLTASMARGRDGAASRARSSSLRSLVSGLFRRPGLAQAGS